MADELHVVPDDLRYHALHLQHLKDQVEHIRSSVGAKFDAMGAVWGDGDPIGDRFRNGPNGQQDQLDGFHRWMGAITNVFEGCSNKLTHTANSCEQFDHNGPGV